MALSYSDLKRNALEDMASGLNNPEELRRKKQRAFSEVMAQGTAAQQQALRSAQQQGITSGQNLMAGSRVVEGVAEQAGKAATQLEAEESEKQWGRQAQLAQLSMGAQEQEESSAARSEQLAMQKQQLDSQRDNDLWNRSYATKQLQQQFDLETKKMDMAWDQYKQGRIDQFDLQKMGQDFQEKMQGMAQKFSKEQQDTQNALAVAQQNIQRGYQVADQTTAFNQAKEMADYQKNISLYLAQKQKELNEKSGWEKGLGIAGSVVSMLGTAATGAALIGLTGGAAAPVVAGAAGASLMTSK